MGADDWAGYNRVLALAPFLPFLFYLFYPPYYPPALS